MQSFMDILYHFTHGVLYNHLLPSGIPDWFTVLYTLSLSIFDSPERAEMYLIMAFFLVMITISIQIFKQFKSKQMLKQAEQLRRDIFTKITHEFRTPLTIILGLSKQLRAQYTLPASSLTYLDAIERQGKYLNEIVNQLLDLANLQMSDRTIEWKTGNVVAFIEMVSETFRIYAEHKEIELVFFSDETVIEIDFAPDYLKKILYNLLSNAIKYSDDGSRIVLKLERNRKERKSIIIKVIDRGKGISKEKLPYIFDLFYKCQLGDVETSLGKGVGLTIVKQLTELLGGTIRVESEPGKGSTFTVELPDRKSENQLLSNWKFDSNTQEAESNNLIDNKYEHDGWFSYEANENDPRTSILLVEDNKDIALFIRSIFHQDQFNIIYAQNGEKAWDIMNHKYFPDIVITDLIMPKMGGIELCREMKASPTLNHIPIIIISAKNKETDFIEGLKSGADSYIRKPFYPEELQVCVQNLLEKQHLLKEKYYRTITGVKVESQNHIGVNFLRKVTDIIYREMKNPDFTPVKLAQELAISVSQLNKKLNTATGYPSSIYILKVKLEHAKKILASQNKTVGEVASECGIYDVNYFSRIFKKHNGITPTQFKRLPPKTSHVS